MRSLPHNLTLLVAEQIKRMHGEYDKVETNLNFADRTIRGMESMWGSVKNWMTKSSAERERPPSAGAAESAKLDRASAARQAASGSRAGSDVRGASSRSVEEKTYGEDWKGKLSKMEDQQDRDLDDLSRMVTDLKGMGKDMSYTLDAQTKSLDHLGDRTDVLGSRLKTSERKIGKMIGR